MFITKSNKNYSSISLNSLKEDLSISLADSTYDSQLRRYLKAAISEAENVIHDDICLTSNVLEESSYIVPFSILEYDVPSVNANITGITYTYNTITTVLMNSDYYVERYNNFTRIKFKNVIVGNKLLIYYQSGFSEIPMAVQRAISVKCGEFLDIDRNGYVTNTLIASKAFNRLLSSYTNLI
jgi:hypothetical protein